MEKSESLEVNPSVLLTWHEKVSPLCLALFLSLYIVLYPLSSRLTPPTDIVLAFSILFVVTGDVYSSPKLQALGASFGS